VVAAPLGAILIALTGETLLTRHAPRGALDADAATAAVSAAAGGRVLESRVSIDLQPTVALRL